MFERPILIYSNHCIHSQNFINILLKVPQIFEAFVRLNIDINPETNARNPVFYEIQNILQYKITEVPTIIVDNGNYVLTGEEAFKWLDYYINKGNNNSNIQHNSDNGNNNKGDNGNNNKGDNSSGVEKEVEGFNSIEMGSFSDMYSTYGSSDLNDARDQSFQFLDRMNISIETPPEDGSTDYKSFDQKQQEREHFDNIRKADVRENFIKNMDHTYNSQKNTFNKKNSKQDDVDRKLKQLLTERESFGNVPKAPSKVVNFNI